MQRSGAVQLRLAGSRSHGVLRELHGTDEHAVDGTTTGAAIRLLDGLLLDGGRGAAAGLSQRADGGRPRPPARVGVPRTPGGRIESTVCCRACEEGFELDFDLGELIWRASRARRYAPPEAGRVQLGDGVLAEGFPPAPTSSRSRHCPRLRPRRRSCIAARWTTGQCRTPWRSGAALEAVAPVADLDLDGTCPECGEAQVVHFDLQAYLLESIAADRARLMRDVHALEVERVEPRGDFGLSRRERRTLATLADANAIRRERSLA